MRNEEIFGLQINGSSVPARLGNEGQIEWCTKTLSRGQSIAHLLCKGLRSA